MTPQELARIHADSFSAPESWSASAIAQTLDTPYTKAFTTPHGFAITRTVAGESELLTLAVAPSARRQGIARKLLCQWLAAIEGQAERAFLEVAADNDAAIALYESLAFQRTGVRRGYYDQRSDGPIDAVLMSRAVTHGHAGPDTPQIPETG